MPALISGMARSSGVASRSSTILAIPSPESLCRTIRPYPAGSATTAVTTVASARAVSWAFRTFFSVSDDKRGTSPDRRSRVPELCPSTASVESSACAVPSCGSCTTKPRPARPDSAAWTASAWCPTTMVTDRGARVKAVSSTWLIIGRPATWCRTLGRADFMRVPFPAARTTMCRGVLKYRTSWSTQALDYRQFSVRSAGESAAGDRPPGRVPVLRRAQP